MLHCNLTDQCMFCFPSQYTTYSAYRSFVITEFLILTGIFLILNNAEHLDTLQVRSIISQILSMAVILGAIRLYIAYSFRKEIDDLNEHLK